MNRPYTAFASLLKIPKLPRPRERERAGVRATLKRSSHPHLNPLPPKEGEEEEANTAIFILCGHA